MPRRLHITEIDQRARMLFDELRRTIAGHLDTLAEEAPIDAGSILFCAVGGAMAAWLSKNYGGDGDVPPTALSRLIAERLRAGPWHIAADLAVRALQQEGFFAGGAHGHSDGRG